MFKLSVFRARGAKKGWRDLPTSQDDKQLNITLSNGRVLRLLFLHESDRPKIILNSDARITVSTDGSLSSEITTNHLEITPLD